MLTMREPPYLSAMRARDRAGACPAGPETVAIRTDQSSGLTRRADPEPADLREDGSRYRRVTVLNSHVDDGEKLLLRRSAMRFGTSTQSLYHMVRHILD